MVFVLLGGAIAWAGFAMPATAQRLMPDGGNGRYSLVPKDDGFMRLDSRTGEVSICAWRGAGWECIGVPDDRAAYDAEIGRLRDVVDRLKRELAARDRLAKESIKSAETDAKDTSRPPNVEPPSPTADRNSPPAKVIDMPAPVAADMMRAANEMALRIERLQAEIAARDRVIAERAQSSREQEAAVAQGAERRAADAAEIARLKEETDRLARELAARERAVAERARSSREQEAAVAQGAERRAADAAEIARLKEETERLTRELAARERAVAEVKNAAEAAEKELLRLRAPPLAEPKPAEAEKEPPSGRHAPPIAKGAEPRLPDEAELDRALAYLERAWRKLIDMVQRLQKEPDPRI